jgi:hypothetical protein
LTFGFLSLLSLSPNSLQRQDLAGQMVAEAKVMVGFNEQGIIRSKRNGGF